MLASYDQLQGNNRQITGVIFRFGRQKVPFLDVSL